MYIKQTKTVLLSVIVLLTLLLFFQACEKSDSTGLIGTITLADKETQTIVHQGKSITITASDFNDSRCPTNANCIWEGIAIVKITFKDDVKTQELNLCLGGCNIAQTPKIGTVTLNRTTFKITLEEITPYPTTDKNKPGTSKVKITFSE